MKNLEAVAGARTAYDNVADQYDVLFTPFQEAIMYPRIMSLLGSLVGDFQGKKILDLGCGTGAFATEVKKRRADYCGIDISRKLLGFAKLRGCSVVGASIHELPFVDESFDAIVSNFVLHYLSPEGQAIALKEAARVLGHSGTFVFSYMHPVLMRLGRHFDSEPYYRPTISSYYEPQKEEIINFHGQTFKIYLRDFPEIINDIIDAGFAIERILDADFPENLDKVLAKTSDENSRRFIQNFRFDPYAIFVAARKAL